MYLHKYVYIYIYIYCLNMYQSRIRCPDSSLCRSKKTHTDSSEQTFASCSALVSCFWSCSTRRWASFSSNSTWNFAVTSSLLRVYMGHNIYFEHFICSYRRVISMLQMHMAILLPVTCVLNREDIYLYKVALNGSPLELLFLCDALVLQAPDLLARLFKL